MSMHACHRHHDITYWFLHSSFCNLNISIFDRHRVSLLEPKVTIFGLEGGKGKDGYIHELYGCNIGLEEQVISKELLKTAAQTSWMVYIPQQFVIFVSR